MQDLLLPAPTVSGTEFAIYAECSRSATQQSFWAVTAFFLARVHPQLQGAVGVRICFDAEKQQAMALAQTSRPRPPAT